MLDFKDNVTEADCWFGGLVAAGIAPQLNSDSGSAKISLAPRVRWWMDLFRRYGTATESTVRYLHYDDVFLIGLRGGSELGDHRGLYIGGNTSSVNAEFPPDVADNATVLVAAAYGVASGNVSYGAAAHRRITFFAACNVTLHMGGAFWNLNDENVQQKVIGADGNVTRTQDLFPAATTGQFRHSVKLQIGEYTIYTKVRGCQQVSAA
eukprot:SAG22_NODE_8159_length_678_cov_1.018998_1_plen_207_part_01